MPTLPSAARPRPTRLRRLTAAALDALIAIGISLLLSVPAGNGELRIRLFGGGLLLGALFVLGRDALPGGLLNRASPGKAVMGLQALRRDGSPLDFSRSVQRNMPLAGALLVPGLITLATGYHGFPFSTLLIWGSLGPVVLEAALVLIDPVGRRIGDRWADTRVRVT